MLRSFILRLIPDALRPEQYLDKLVRKQSGLQVRKGPFSGLRYVDDSVGSTYLPKLLGTYEQELAQIVEQALQKPWHHVIDIGAAEGYYAVGLAKRLPGVTVTAYELEATGRQLLTRMANLNGVQNQIKVQGKCEPEDLAATLGNGTQTLIVCDVEGYEQKLLDPSNIPALQRATLLIELHEFAVPGITNLLKERFATTHKNQHMVAQERSPADFPYSNWYTRLLPSKHLLLPTAENRPERMAWLWLEPI